MSRGVLPSSLSAPRRARPCGPDRCQPESSRRLSSSDSWSQRASLPERACYSSSVALAPSTVTRPSARSASMSPASRDSFSTIRWADGHAGPLSEWVSQHPSRRLGTSLILKVSVFPTAHRPPKGEGLLREDTGAFFPSRWRRPPPAALRYRSSSNGIGQREIPGGLTCLLAARQRSLHGDVEAPVQHRESTLPPAAGRHCRRGHFDEAPDPNRADGPAPEGSRNGLRPASAAFVLDGRIETRCRWNPYSAALRLTEA